ncbi:MAG: MarR family transcriptional regulator [Actinomycetota bacterium]
MNRLTNQSALGAETWLAVLQVQSVVVQLLEERLQAALSLPLAWFEVLLHLGGATDERMRMNDLAHGLVLSKSGVTRLIDRIEAAGFVARKPCGADRRVTYVALTEPGRVMLARAIPVHSRAVEEVFTKHLQCEQIEPLTAALGRVIEANGFAPMPCSATVAGKVRSAKSSKSTIDTIPAS